MDKYEEGIKILKEYYGQAADLVLDSVMKLPANYVKDDIEWGYGECVGRAKTQFDRQTFAASHFSCLLGMGNDLSAGVFALLAAGYTKQDIENLLVGLSPLIGLSNQVKLFANINGAIAAWDSQNK